MTRIASFNDFSPSILNEDLRVCLRAIAERGADSGGSDAEVIAAWETLFFPLNPAKRASTNIPATLSSTGLSTGTRPIRLSAFGENVLGAPTPQDAARIFCAGLIENKNGWLVIDALRNMRARRVAITKESLAKELAAAGVELSNGTTDHTTFRNWLRFAGLISADFDPVDEEIKKALGISATERDEFLSLPLAQQVFLHELRKEHEVAAGPFQVATIFRRCVEIHDGLFDNDRFASQVRIPLVDSEWIEISGLPTGKQGGRSGYVKGTKKLLDISINNVLPDFEEVVPPSLRSKLNTPLSEIATDLFGKDIHKGGLALELLSLRMIIDLGLSPRHFRRRAADTAYAEVDLIAEGAHLHFSRWTFQCKRYATGKTSTKVSLSEVAKEVGIAVFARAHVVVMVTTSDFSRDARNYALEVSRATPLQFVFVNGEIVKAYLKQGASALRQHFQANAQSVLAAKAEQPLPNE